MDIISEKGSELVESLLGERPLRCHPFGAGKFSQTFEVCNENNAQFVLRIAPPDTLLQLFYEYHMMRQEPGIHKRLLKETSVPPFT